MSQNTIEINTFEGSRMIKKDYLSHVHMRDNNMLIVNLTQGPSLYLTFLSREEKIRCYVFLKVVMEKENKVYKFDEEVVINKEDITWMLDKPEIHAL